MQHLSPITLCEIRHLERSRQVYNRLSNWLNRALWLSLLIPALSIALFCVLLAAVDPLQFATHPGERYLTITRILGVISGVTFYLHFQVQVTTLGMAADSIAREKRSGTWESLLLTGLDARQLVWGKWIAIVRLMWRDYLRLGLLRVGATVGIGALILTEPRIGLVQLSSEPQEWAVFRMLLAAVLVMGITLLNCFFTAAVGVFSAFFTRVGTPGSSTAFVARLGFVLAPVLTALFPVLIVLSGHREVHPELLSLVGNWQLLLLDNGTSALAGLANPLDSWAAGYLAVIVAGVATYVGLTTAALYLAKHIAKQQGAA